MTTSSDPSDGLAGLAELLRQDPAPEAPSPTERDSDEVRRRRRRRRIGLIITAIVLVVLIAVPAGYAAWALTAPLASPIETSQAPRVPPGEPVALRLPSEGASAISVAGADEYLGPDAAGIWASSGGDEARPIASISKLITALVVLDAKPLAGVDDPGPTITFSEADHDLYDTYYVQGATIAAMPAGSSMSLHDALATMLIPSASNYAEAVSTWAFGSQRAFLNATRRWLEANGLTGTTIVEPTGISPRNMSTPADLLAIGKLAAANPVIAQIVATRSLWLPVPGPMANTNTLLGIDGVTGLKTGNLGEGSHNLVYTATFEVGAAEPLRVTGVVLGGFSRDTVNTSVVALLDSIRSGFHDIPVATAGRDVGEYSTPWGSTAKIVLAEDASIFTWSDTPIVVTMETLPPETYRDGEVVGSITWTAGPQSTTVPLEIEGSIEDPEPWWRLTNPGELGR
ncbi:D-alanyl-D-alanine carboxypeptidase family protein [Microbacterium sp. SLBN-146]|uniref:D-alanyl-D-alanine carboxypeptidase family protein n=1 Tax=Microbacterium sp. SLBN-146 TaxID=2768457 RepID=UPI00114F8514|nr:D-alanyl-D-alanine carboxypeptidase [Microbacterium sp. SLBN-146]TQJ31132.1 D-alanyl-D-alanine carboxypeptidase (penicillin-binding protein 5/6) [Microbacterium sp. SLBN-146]